MKLPELLTLHNKIITLILEGSLKQAFDRLSELINENQSREYKVELDNHLFTYQNMLTYSFESADDPEREKVYQSLLRNMVSLADRLKEQLAGDQQLYSYYRFRYSNDYHKIKALIENNQLTRIMEEDEDIPAGEKVKYSNIYEFYWLLNGMDDKSETFLTELNNSQKVPWYYKCLLVSATTLSCFRYFDKAKIDILLRYVESQEHQIWQRALVGLVLIMFYYDERLQLFPEITEKLKVLKEEHNLEENIELIIVQFIRARDTERISKKIQEEIMPDMMKMRTKLTEKLNLDEITSLEELHEKNPDWQVMFEETPDLYDKVEKISQMQMEGVDVFHSAFSMLKHFPFFNEISNWFLPFYKENQEVKKIFNTDFPTMDTEQFLDGLERSGFMCNSDKYSFCYNIHMLPDNYKQQLIKLFDMELNAMNEMENEDELVNTKARNKFIFNQYIQDLYRFYKVFPKRNELFDIFSLDINFKESEMLQSVVENKNILRNIGEFYFEYEHYDKAISVFTFLSEAEGNLELLEKIAYAYQKSGDYENAVTYYKKADLLESNKVWLLKKLGYCNRLLKNFNEAFTYYEQAEKLEPENLQIQASLGNIYMDLEKYHDALEKYFKVEYLSPNNINIMRPLAWCSMQIGKLENAKKYLTRISEKERNAYDLLNLGHIEWGIGNKQKAVSFYGLSIKAAENGLQWFRDEMNEDSRLLENMGVNNLDIKLMTDYLSFNQ
jgi:tetratricopeptide (TPR) repeat protein